MSPRSIAILLGPLAVITLVVILVLLLLPVPVWLAVVLPLVLAAAVAAWFYTRADSMVANAVGGSPVGPDDQPRLTNMIKELCARAGLSEPDVRIVDSASINAMAYGTSAASGGLVVTSGAVNRLTLVQLEGLLARELGRLRRGDPRVDTLAVPFLRVLLSPVPALGRKLLEMLRGQDIEPTGDMAGLDLTRYPPGLLEAFVAMKEAGDPASASGPTSHLWTRMPEGMSRWSIDDRIALLREL